MSILSLANNAALVKMKIYGCTDASRDIKAADTKTFEVLFNPPTYSKKFEIEYNAEQAAGTTGTEQKFQSIKPQDYSFDFYIDGTVYGDSKVTSEAGYVETKVKEFLDTVYTYQGTEHKPYYVLISWSSFSVKCIFKSADINYSLFKPDGTPLRAKITANFSESIPDELRVAEANPASPDLTHIREFQASDTLPLMSNKIYKDPKYYFQVAEKNELNNFRRISQGTKIKYPPVGDESV